MKKSIIVALVCFFGLTQANAQVSFRPGVKGGLNFSHFTQTDDPNQRFTSKTDFYVGVLGALKLSKVYTLQPELTYTRQGAKNEYFNPNDNIVYKNTINISYVSLGIANKFTFNKFNFLVGPTIDIRVTDKKKNLGYVDYDVNNDGFYDNGIYNDYNSFNGIDFAFFAGLGYDITKNLGLEARIKKGIIPIDDNNWDYTNVVFQVGATYTFDLKK